MYKLIASDVDGTLVKEGTSTLNPELFAYILKLKQQGIRFVAASGRQYESIRKAFEPIRDDILFIADNGSFVYEKDQMLISNTFPLDTYRELVRYLKTLPDVILMVSSLEGSFTDGENDAFLNTILEGYGMAIAQVEDLAALDIHVSKIGAYFLSGDLEQISREGRAKYGQDANILISGERWIDYLPQGVNKGKGLHWIQDYLNIPVSQTISFGDQNNDISLFRQSGISYAVPAAKEEVKAAATDVMKEGPERDGVLHVLQQVFG